MDLPNQDTLRLLVTRYAALRAAHGDAFAAPPLVLPTGTFFPDEFKGDADGVAAFFKRLASYAPLAPSLPLGLRFVEDEEEGGEACGTGGCGPAKASCGPTKGGACGPGESEAAPRIAVHDAGEGYVVDLAIADAQTATRLAASLARSVGALVLQEAGEEPEDMELEGEVAAVACGYGVLLAAGSYQYKKGCGGVRVHQSTTLAPAELGVLLALFVRAHGHKPAEVRGHLEVTPREAFDAALAWVDSYPELARDLVAAPARLASGLFEVGPTKGFFGRLFSRPAKEPAPITPPAKRQRTPEEERRIRESRALVEEALGK